MRFTEPISFRFFLLALSLFTSTATATIIQLPEYPPTNIEPIFNSSIQMEHLGAYLPDLYWEWEPEPRWLSGFNFGFSTFFGSLDFGVNFFGSTLADTEYVEVELRFSSTETTYGQTYRRDLGYAASGVGTFPGSAWDISEPDNLRRLNICFVEDNNQQPANLTWDPDESRLGRREYLFIMASDYDSTGLSYDDDNWGPGADVMYAWWPRLEPEHTFFETDPATLRIRLAYIYDFLAIPDDRKITLTWAFDEAGADSFKLYADIPPAPDKVLATLPMNTRTFLHSSLPNGVTYYYRLEAVSITGELLYRSVELAAYAQVMARHMDLLGAWNERSRYGDIWGHTAPSGREYALLCARNEGLSIVDITTDPPVEVGFVPSITPFSDAKDVKVYDHYAILIKQMEPAQVIDLSNPANAVTVSTIHIGSSNTDGGAHNCYVDGHYLYTVGNHDIGGLIIYDLTDPASPTHVGEYQPYYYHDLYVRNDTAYVAAFGQGVDILDVSDKTTPTLIVNFNYSGSGAHNCWTTEDGDYIFVGDEIGIGNWTRVFDVSSPHNVEQVGTYIVDSLAVVHNSYVKGNYLYVAHYTEGVRVVDITNPAIPVEVAYYDTYPIQEYGFHGAWSVYPFFSSGKIIASDLQTGLYVLEVDWKGVETVPSKPFLPTGFLLAQNYPNPFNPTTTIEFSLPTSGFVTLSVYDVMGRNVESILNQHMDAGTHNLQWDASNVPTGIYFVKMVSGDFTQTRKMILLR